MKHRKLRIAWSVGWGVVAVLLCVLWLRSYWIALPLPKLGGHTIVVSKGNLEINRQLARSNWRIVDTVTFQLDDGTGRFGVEGPTAVQVMGLVVPCWTLMMLPVTGIISPWLSYKRFSLRTLLLATTLLAVLLGLVVYAVKR